MELNKENYTSATSADQRPSVVMVKASWCSNCKAMAPEFEKSAKEMEGKVDFHYLTVDDNEEFARSLKIMGVPTTLFYRHGTLINKKVGRQSFAAIVKTVEPLLHLSDDEAKDKEYRNVFRRLFGRK